MTKISLPFHTNAQLFFEVLLHVRVTITLVKMRKYFRNEKLFLISNFDEVENFVNTDFLN